MEFIFSAAIQYWPIVAGFVAFFVLVLVVGALAPRKNSSHYGNMVKRG